MGELDILLAKEFSRRHGLYDKKSPHFKDREYNDNAWREIAATLGYNVDILKDRMLQLRNRYNVEKRKYDSLCAQYPNSKAQWPLYYHLNFLDGHIRPRRQYRTMGSEIGGYSGSLRHPQMNVTPSPPPLIKAPTAQLNPVARRRGRPPKKFVYPPEYCNNGDSPKPTPELQHLGKQEFVQVHNSSAINNTSDEEEVHKNEEDDDEEEENDEVLIKCEVISNSDEDQENSGHGEFINPVNLLAQTASPEGDTQNTDEAQPNQNSDEYEQPTQSNTVNNTNNSAKDTPNPNTLSSASSSPVRVTNRTDQTNNNTTTTTAAAAVSANTINAAISSKKRRNDELILKLHRSPCKYQAFGQFVAASLSELADDRALNLIEKFTIQIVSSMRENHNPEKEPEVEK